MSTQINGSMALRFLPFNTPSPETADTCPSARGQNGYRPPSSQQPHNANYAWNRPQPARPGNNPNRPQPALPENAGHRPLPARPGNHWQPAQDDWQRPPHNSSNRPQPAHPGNNPHRPQRIARYPHAQATTGNLRKTTGNARRTTAATARPCMAIQLKTSNHTPPRNINRPIPNQRMMAITFNWYWPKTKQ